MSAKEIRDEESSSGPIATELMHASGSHLKNIIQTKSNTAAAAGAEGNLQKCDCEHVS